MEPAVVEAVAEATAEAYAEAVAEAAAEPRAPSPAPETPAALDAQRFRQHFSVDYWQSFGNKMDAIMGNKGPEREDAARCAAAAAAAAAGAAGPPGLHRRPGAAAGCGRSRHGHHQPRALLRPPPSAPLRSAITRINRVVQDLLATNPLQVGALPGPLALPPLLPGSQRRRQQLPGPRAGCSC
jgi:hypothetical protein